MTRYQAAFEACRNRGDGVLGAFLMLGDPTAQDCPAYLDALVEGGADMVEFGIPFSDPVADGPVIQAAGDRALKAGVRTAECLAILSAFRARHGDVPVGVLTYANIVAARGIDRFAHELAQAGVDSLLIADVPTLEAQPYAAAARAAGIDLVMIAASTTPLAALERIASLSSGYTYCVARLGVTGADRRPQLDHKLLFSQLASLGAAPPILGFGIASPEDVRAALAAGAAGAISGSAIIQLIADGEPPSTVRGFVETLKAATRGRAA